jgi:hypothetical protein
MFLEFGITLNLSSNMNIFISLVVAISLYFVLYKLLFEDIADFIAQLKNFIYRLPIGVIFDYSPDGGSNWRVSVWLLGGLAGGFAINYLLR